jgi:hypothetical protein
MSDSSHPLTPAAATSIAPVPAHPTPQSLGLDPDDYDWVPVPRQRNRAGGWSFAAQRTFIEVLADTGSVTTAAKAVNMTRQACYKFYREPGAENFARAWDAAMDRAGRALLDAAMDRVIHGDDVLVLNKEGEVIHIRTRKSDRLTMFLLRGYFPGKFGRAPAPAVSPEAPAAGTASIPLHQTIAALEPPRPADPFAAMTPNAMADFLYRETDGDVDLPYAAPPNPSPNPTSAST